MRLLPLLDFDMIRKNPKPLIGYSDITVLHTSINKLCGFITFHGPMPNTDYSRLDDFTLDSLRSQLFHPQEICELQNPPGQKLQVLYPTGPGTTLSDTPLYSRYLWCSPCSQRQSDGHRPPHWRKSVSRSRHPRVCLGDRYEEHHPLFRRRGRAPLPAGPQLDSTGSGRKIPGLRRDHSRHLYRL